MQFSIAALVTSMVAMTAALPAECPAEPPADVPAVNNNTASEKFTGEATYYTQDGAIGACGIANGDDSMIAALGWGRTGAQYKHADCGRQIRILNLGSHYPGLYGEGNSVVVTVADSCEACKDNDVDLSVAAWNELTDTSQPGRLAVEWEFLD